MIERNRLTDTYRAPDTGKPLPLPIVDWKRIGQTAPEPITGTYDGSDAPLPKADVAVLTWTTAEWNAFDHVFLNSGSTRSQDDRDWEHAWHTYSRQAPSEKGQSEYTPLWGLYRLVDIPTRKKKLRVLLFKCDAHLAYAPWLQGLAQMTAQILDETGASWIWSIGTAGGSRETENLGDVIITNSGTIKLQKPENLKSGLNNKSFRGKGFPSTKLFATVQKHLFFDMASVVTWPALDRMLRDMQQKDSGASGLTLDELVNPPLDPKNLRQSRVVPMEHTPLLTTDYYYIADGNDAAKYAVLEMDDCVIAYVAQEKNRQFAFARNISDPIVPVKAKGKAIPYETRKNWSSEIYSSYGFYTSFNGALATWAALSTM